MAQLQLVQHFGNAAGDVDQCHTAQLTTCRPAGGAVWVQRLQGKDRAGSSPMKRVSTLRLIHNPSPSGESWLAGGPVTISEQPLHSLEAP